MIGYRGCYRYVEEPELFALELRGARPGARGDAEPARDDPVRAHPLGAGGVPRAHRREPAGPARGLQRWVMAEVPSVVYRIPEYAELGIDGVSIGSNDLTQLMLGVDRDSEICAELFDEWDAAVLDAIERIIRGQPLGGHDVVALRPGAVELARVRRAPGAVGHRLDLGEPRCGGPHATRPSRQPNGASCSTRRGAGRPDRPRRAPPGPIRASVAACSLGGCRTPPP